MWFRVDRGTRCLSKVIKAPIWKEDVHVIDAPSPKRKSPEERSEDAGLDAEAQAHMLEEIAAKEQKANQMLQDAKVSCDIMRQEAQNECDKLMADAQEELENLKNQAREAGHQEGFEAGEKEGKEQALQEMQEAMRSGGNDDEHS